MISPPMKDHAQSLGDKHTGLTMPARLSIPHEQFSSKTSYLAGLLKLQDTVEI